MFHCQMRKPCEDFLICCQVLFANHFFLNQNATFTNPIITGTSTSGPITAAKASPELIPKTAMATAIANSKLLLAAVNDNEAAIG